MIRGEKQNGTFVPIIRVGTDCSGIEAPIQALKQLKLEGFPIKFKHIFSSDIDPYCIKSIKANYNPKIIYNDMTKRNIKKMPDIDLYICGFPCQSFSMAGKRKGMKEKRGQIFWHCLEVIEEKLPTVFILENVKGLLSIDKGKTFEHIIQSLKDLNYYDIYWKVLNTKDYGIPQNRERLFIIGIAQDELSSLQDSSLLSNEDPTERISNFKWPSKKRMKSLDSFVDWNDVTPNKTGLTDRVKQMKKHIPKNSKFIDLSFKHATYPNSDKYTPSLIRSGSLWCVPLKRYANIKEMLELQGFPSNFKQDVSNTQLKRQIGNSMSVCVLKELFKEIYNL